MSRFERLTRRAFVRDLGAGTLAIAVGGLLASCSGDEGGGTTVPGDTTSTTSGNTPSTTSSTTPGTTTSTTDQTEPTTTTPSEGITWERVSLGIVSAYVLVRSGTAAVIDTGVPGSAGSIEEVLASIGLGWADVSDVVLTHLHNDHIGSLGAVMAAASEADGHAGAADIPAMDDSPRPIMAVADGDRVFGLDVIETPGHTAGHICLLDPVAGVLVAGDALNGSGGGVAGPNPDFSSDHALALESVRKLAGHQFDTALFGHGDPVVGGAGARVAELAAEF